MLILLTFTAGGVSTKATSATVETSEELRIVAFDCLTALFSCYAQSPEPGALTESQNIPAIGHAVTVLLDGMCSGSSNNIQLAAISALSAFQECVDEEVLASFFPGITSSLTKTLQQDSRSKKSWRVLEASLNLLCTVLQAVLDDGKIEKYLKSGKSIGKQSGHETPLDESWLKATASQVKLALATVIVLQYHDRFEVRCALLNLCQTMLERCRKSLSTCTTIMVETIISISWDESTGAKSESERALDYLAAADSSVTDSIKSSLHAWVTALPRIMQSNDERSKGRIIHQISVASRILSDLGVEASMLADMLANNLRDSVLAVIAGSRASSGKVQVNNDLGSVQQLALRDASASVSLSFQSELVSQKSQQVTLRQLQLFLRRLSHSAWAPDIARSLLDYLPNTSGDERPACFWMIIHMTKEALNNALTFDPFTENETSSSEFWAETVEELYSYSVSLLLTSWKDQQDDWRLQNLALETVALRADQLKLEFRLELVEILYPVVHSIGSPQSQLQSHAITCLNIIAQACGYPNASRLIIENVDYLVNAIALKLNTFDISPQAPQVLLMMIKLAGPPLLPYLDDLVESIFAALDNFHGYPRLVELLFSVLREIVQEGSKSDVLKITSGSANDHQKAPYRPRTLKEVAALLADSTRRAASDHVPDGSLEHASFLARPWQRASSASDEMSRSDPEEDEADDTNKGNLTTTMEDKPTPTPKTYTMLQSIARLSQHYLTHESPRLRRELLLLTSTACTALQNNVDEFLPLINDLWPVVIRRLHDPEPFVVVAAANAVGQMCRSAGDFLASRIETEWADLKALYRRVYQPLQAEKKRRKEARGVGRGIYSPAYQIWEALVALLLTVLEYVRIDDLMLDDLIDMFADLLQSRKDLRDALSSLNPDAVWLEMMLQGRLDVGVEEVREAPRLDGFTFRPMTL